MPIYSYACKSCEHRFDALQKMSDAKLLDCPECGEPSLQKQLSAPKFRLAGSGWYETDFKTGDKRNLVADADAKSAAPDAKKKDSKADTKKSEPKAATSDKASSA